MTGLSNARCRALLGRWKRDLGDDAALVELLAEAQRENVQGPEAWFSVAIRERKRRRDHDRPPATYEEAVAQRDSDPNWRLVQ